MIAAARPRAGRLARSGRQQRPRATRGGGSRVHDRRVFRRFLHKVLPDHLRTFPAADSFVRARLVEPIAVPKDLERELATVESLPIDHSVPPVDRIRGGQVAARRVRKRFYNGIFWILGRYDRPWGPERPIFATVRYMSSENTARKMNVRPYLAEFASTPSGSDRLPTD